MGYLYSAIKKVAYKFLEITTRNTGLPVSINNLKLKLPAKYFRLFPSDYEHASFSFFKKHLKKGATGLDIGAHIGVYSVFFAKITNGKVYSFEPTPSTVNILRNTIKINKCENNVTVIEAAVSEKLGQLTFYSNDIDVSTSNSLVDVDLGDNSIRSGAYEVRVESIDNFRRKKNLKIDFVKIDAEGVELEVLKGANETFLQDRPIGILGLHPFAYKNRTEMLENIWNILFEYKMEIQIEGETTTKDFFCNKQDRVFDVELLPK